MIATADNSSSSLEGGARSRTRAHAGADRRPSLPLHSLVLIAALAGALASQGAYYTSAQWPVAVLLAGALLLALRAEPWTGSDTGFAPLALCVGLAGWGLLRAAAAGEIGDGIGVVALLAGVAATALVAARAGDVDALGAGAVALGVLTALTGWVGVAWRISPWALEDQGLWRAATALTYANAAAGVLAALTLVALGRLAARPDSRATALSACLLLTGLGATLSRGGLLAAAAGGASLAALLGVRPVARAAMAPVTGASVALAGLLPSMPASSSAHPFFASVALLGGLAVTGGLLVGTNRRRAVLLAALPVALGVVLASGEGGRAGAAVGHARLTAASPDRANAVRAAVRLITHHPLVGVGPGRARLAWVSGDGTTLVAKYSHNEFLQLFAELGAVGLALLLVLLVAVARAVRHARAGHPSVPLWAGATAGLVALGVGSGLDFLWHVPAVPLVGGLLVGITVPKAREQEKTQL